jgi:hypothetical protein
MNPAHDVLSIPGHFMFTFSNPYVNLHIKELPVFKPNEYFWKYYWNKDSGEERW